MELLVSLRRWNISIVLFMLIAFGLISCTAPIYRQDTVKKPSLPEPVVYETQVAIGSCAIAEAPGETPLAAIAGALLSAAITEGVNRIGTALTEAAKEKTDKAIASRNVYITNTELGPCVQVVRGWFYTGPPGTPEDDQRRKASAENWYETGFIDANNYGTFESNSLWLANRPDFVVE